METITYDYVWEVYQKEKGTNELQQVYKTFYSDIAEYIKKLETETNDESEATKSNTKRLVNSIYERRKQKIMVYVAYGKTLPQSVAKEETDFYNAIIKLFNENVVDSKVMKEANSQKVLRAACDIPEIFLPSGGKLGPVGKSELINISSEEDKEYLITNKLCEAV